MGGLIPLYSLYYIRPSVYIFLNMSINFSVNVDNKLNQTYNLGKVTTMLCRDLEAAFDTSENNKQKIRCKSRECNLSVPHTCSLNPLLFLLYVNDIPKNAKTVLALFTYETAILDNARRIYHANKSV